MDIKYKYVQDEIIKKKKKKEIKSTLIGSKSMMTDPLNQKFFWTQA